MGDPFRDGRTRILIYLGAPLLALVASRKISPILCVLWTWWVWVFAWYGPDNYAWHAVVIPPFIVFLARWCVILDHRMVIFCLRISFWIQVLIYLAQTMGWSPQLFDAPVTVPMGTLSQFTLFAAFIAALTPYAFLRWSPLDGMLGIAVVALTGSAMGLGSLGVGFCLIFWKSISRRLALATAGLGGAILGLLWAVLPDNSFMNSSGRTALWPLVWDFAQQRPYGWGPGSWEGLYPFWGVPRAVAGQWLEIHSDWLQLRFEGGWPAVVLAAGYIIGLLYWTRNPLKASVCGAMAVNALANFPFHFTATGFLFCLAMAMPEPHEEA